MEQCPNLMNLSRGSNPAKNRFQLSAGLNLEKLDVILSGINIICLNLSRGSNSLKSASGIPRNNIVYNIEISLFQLFYINS